MLTLRFVNAVVLLLFFVQGVGPNFYHWSAEELSQRDEALSARMRLDHSARGGESPMISQGFRHLGRNDPEPDEFMAFRAL